MKDFNSITTWSVSKGVATPVNPYNKNLQYGYESFLFDFTNSERTKILKLHGHERIVDTPTTVAATYELEYNCHSNGSCSNCSGISCCAIFVPNQEFMDFEKEAQQHTYAIDAPDGSYSADRFGEIEEQYLALNDQWYNLRLEHNTWAVMNDTVEIGHGQFKKYRQFLHFIDQVKEAESPKFGECISVKEIESDMSEVAIDSIKELAKKTVKNFKKTGLMSTELCLIALYILEEYSDSAKTLIKGMSNLEALLSKADILLKELSTSPPKTL